MDATFKQNNPMIDDICAALANMWNNATSEPEVDEADQNQDEDAIGGWDFGMPSFA